MPTNSNVKVAAYADDVIVFASGTKLIVQQNEINTYINEIDAYYKSWGVKINTEKCESIKFYNDRNSYRNCRRFRPNIKIGEDTIAERDCIKYLGVTLDKKLCFKKHIKQKIDKAKGALLHWRMALKPSTRMNFKIQRLIYLTMVRSHLTYGYPIWFNIASANMKSLKTFERTFFRRVLNLRPHTDAYGNIRSTRNTVIYKKANIPEIDNFLIETAYKALKNATFLENEIIKNTLQCTNKPKRNDLYIAPKHFIDLYESNVFKRNNDLNFYDLNIENRKNFLTSLNILDD